MSDAHLIVPDAGGRAELEFRHLLCGRHAVPFARRWPLGYPTAAVALWDRVLDIPEFAAACAGRLDRAVPLLAKQAACCRLDPDVLLAVYRRVQETCAVWVLGRCRVCNRRNARGGPARDEPRPGRTRRIAHLCLHCVVYATVLGPGGPAAQ